MSRRSASIWALRPFRSSTGARPYGKDALLPVHGQDLSRGCPDGVGAVRQLGGNFASEADREPERER
ncbi:protein of unknown function [Candidatus Bipolaricaulis anaerobius]|uniref:Uncharacterized protein n=1 Tax=Candidatus Bipolaricaulis anaerobius TaxID=2026885 RepID=A0A2X3MJM1_9BACT|nr:protein of unknown function [Candidatus Bipolaricaulis anaerobius]